MGQMTEETGRLVLTAATLAAMALASALHWLVPIRGGGWSGGWAEGLALLAVFAAGGIPAAIRAIGTLIEERQLDIDLLMVLAALAAAAVGAALEGAVLLSLFSLSTTLEHRAMGRTRRAIEALMDLRPDRALLRHDGTEREVAVASLQPGDVVILRPGARVPVDGVIVEGEGALDESTITGESVPVHKAPGAPVFEATVNLHGVLAVAVSRALAESTVARMIALVTEAQSARAPSERFSEWFGQRYTIAVLLGAILAFGGFLALGQGWHAALYKAATLLVAASPCAIVISVPAAILSALSAAARGGVLFKGGAALETLAAVSKFAFDKTGTLTTGRQEVVDIHCIGDESDFLARLAGIEAQSEHPIADAIRRLAAARGLRPVRLREARAVPGEGMVAVDEAGMIWAGNARLAARMGAKTGGGGTAAEVTSTVTAAVTSAAAAAAVTSTAAAAAVTATAAAAAVTSAAAAAAVASAAAAAAVTSAAAAAAMAEDTRHPAATPPAATQPAVTPAPPLSETPLSETPVSGLPVSGLPLSGLPAALADAPRTLVLMGRGARLLGAVTCEDRPRGSAAAGLAALRRGGIGHIAMLTGDRQAVADRIGAELGIAPADIHADLRPEDKVQIVAALAARGRVAFVGDGVNDAAALARADVGIAMGVAGSEVALQAADVALLADDIGRLAEAHRLARRAARIIRQNLVFAIGAMLGLVTAGLFFQLPLPVAVIGHEGGTVLVVLNGLRLLADPIRKAAR